MQPGATVAGAGALGLSCAIALADAGFEVTVCDPAPNGPNASSVAGGMLAPVFEAVLDAEARPHFDLLLAARDLWPAMEARTGVRVDRSGALAAGRRDWLHLVSLGLGRLGLHATEIPRAAADALAPGLSTAAAGAVLNREDWRLDPLAALASLRAAAAAAGVGFRAEAARPRRGDLLVIAAGAASQLEGFAPELGAITPIKGHILRLATASRPAVTVRGEEAYVTPADGALAVGATMEPGVTDPRPDPAKAAPLLAAGARLFPALAGAASELQAGVRAATSDGLPLVGFSHAPGVLLATGARRNGWLLAPLIARTAAALATGRDPGPFAARLAPGRFAAL